MKLILNISAKFNCCCWQSNCFRCIIDFKSQLEEFFTDIIAYLLMTMCELTVNEYQFKI